MGLYCGTDIIYVNVTYRYMAVQFILIPIGRIAELRRFEI